MLNICLIGLGRTGKEIAKILLQQEDMRLVMAVCSEHSAKEGKNLGEILNIQETEIVVESCSNLEQSILKYKPDVAIDFSNPEATLRNAEALGKQKVPVVVGTTGFNDLQSRKLVSLTRQYKIGILHAPNITTGVNVLMVLTNLAASILENYDCTITESHFKNKKDAPSGTAIKIAKEIAKARSNTTAVHDHDTSDIPIHAIRAGGIIGHHKVILAGEFDKIEISHESFARTAFAMGALKAVKFINNKVGFYEMDDVLDLKNVIMRYLERESMIRKQRYLNFDSNFLGLSTQNEDEYVESAY